MLGRLLRRDGALLWVTHYADGTVTAEASDIFVEPDVADVPWSDSAACVGKVGFRQGLLSPKQPTIQ